MAKEGGYTINNIYQGGYSSLSPKYGNVFQGYYVNAGSFGLTTDPRTANFLQETSSKLSAGAKQIELTGIQPDIFESVPNQHLKEINRLSKLTGVDISLHAPIVEPSGIDLKHGFSETNREGAERQMWSAVERSHELNPEGNVPVTFHSSAGIPQSILGVEGGKEKRVPDEIFIINSETGSPHQIPFKKTNFPGEKEKPEIKDEINRINQENWDEKKKQIFYYYGIAEEQLNETTLRKLLAEVEKKQGKNLNPEEKGAINRYNRASEFISTSYNSMKELFSTAIKRVPDEEEQTIRNFYNEVDEKVAKINKNKGDYQNIFLMSEIIGEGIETLQKISPPKIFQPLDEFAEKRTTETFANVALNSYKKFKNTSPIINIENPPVGGAFSRGEELKKIVEESRKKFVEKAIKPESEKGLGLSKGEAEAAAEKLIGVTWDVGHINMLRKYGYDAKDIIKESEAVKKLVKHIHLSDNFGLEHTELPMGMGNVPIKEILEKLGKEGFDAKKIIEAGNWWQHFKSSPFQETLEYLGSPVFSGTPYWNQTLGFQQGYFPGYGMMLPQVNYETFGAGFSQLPSELGGQRQGAQGSRMSGKQME